MRIDGKQIVLRDEPILDFTHIMAFASQQERLLHTIIR
jgi:hypothetical protein